MTHDPRPTTHDPRPKIIHECASSSALCRSLRGESESSSADRFFEYAGGLAFGATTQAEAEAKAEEEAAAEAEASKTKGAAEEVEDKDEEGGAANGATKTLTAARSAKHGAMHVCNAALTALQISEVARFEPTDDPWVVHRIVANGNDSSTGSGTSNDTSNDNTAQVETRVANGADLDEMARIDEMSKAMARSHMYGAAAPEPLGGGASEPPAPPAPPAGDMADVDLDADASVQPSGPLAAAAEEEEEAEVAAAVVAVLASPRIWTFSAMGWWARARAARRAHSWAAAAAVAVAMAVAVAVVVLVCSRTMPARAPAPVLVLVLVLVRVLREEPRGRRRAPSRARCSVGSHTREGRRRAPARARLRDRLSSRPPSRCRSRLRPRPWARPWARRVRVSPTRSQNYRARPRPTRARKARWDWELRPPMTTRSASSRTFKAARSGAEKMRRNANL